MPTYIGMTDDDYDATMQNAEDAMNFIAQVVGNTARSKGFREDWELADYLDLTAEAVVGSAPEIVVHRQKLHAAAMALRNNVVGAKLMLIVTELAEAMETHRDHGTEGVMSGAGNFGEELADAQIRIGDLADMTQRNIGREVVTKAAKNIARPHKHGRTM